MSRGIEGLRQACRRTTLFLLVIATVPLSAQDMKALSSSLAKSISASGRKTVAVVDFTDLQGNVTELGRYLAEELSVDLVGSAQGFDVIERNQLKVILEEHRLSATGLIDPQAARKLGQFAGVDALVSGTITAFGDTVRLSAKVLDTQTAKMIGAATFEIPRTKAIEDLLQRGIAGEGRTTVTPAAGDSAAKSSTGPSSGLRPTVLTAKAAYSNDRFELMFTPKSCKRHRQEMTCRVEVMNKGEKGIDFSLWERDCSLLDDQGNQYQLDKVMVGQRPSEHLEPDVAINIVAVADNVNGQAKRMTLLLSFRLGYPNDLKAAVRDIPIEQE